MVTEQEARDMWTAIRAFQDSDTAIENSQRLTDITTAQTWYDNIIKPTLKWRSTQSTRRQFQNTLDDRETLEGIVTTDRFRQYILSLEIKLLTERIRLIKAGL